MAKIENPRCPISVFRPGNIFRLARFDRLAYLSPVAPKKRLTDTSTPGRITA